MKKFLANLGAISVGLTFLVLLFLYLPSSFQSLDNRLRDFFFIMRGPIPQSGNVVIVDVDEKSLHALGQWPWERDVIAKLLQNLSNAGAGIIGLDVVFPEQDKSSPAYVNKKLNLHLKNPPDYDAIFAKTIASTPTILGYVFNVENNSTGVVPPQIPAIFIEHNAPEDTTVLKAKGVLLNIAKIQDSAYSSGFFNNIPDDSGMIRSVPLIMSYEDQLYPSLAMEMIRVALDASQVSVNYGELGVESIQAGGLNIPTDRHGRLFINFRGGAKTFHYISAMDVINNSFDKDLVKGKFVLLGTTSTGLLDLRAMPFDAVFPGVEVHANAIDNILTGDFLVRPSWIAGADLSLIIFIFIVSFIVFNYIEAFWIFFAFILEFALIYTFLSYMLFEKGLIFNILFPFASLILSMMLATLMNFFLETKQKNIIKGKFASKVSASVMENILQQQDSGSLHGSEREVTISFSDVRSFTNISEAIDNPKDLIELMNLYMDPMTEIIMEEKGTVDKFIGDAIMSYWNAPQDVEEHADRAVIASIRQLHALGELNEKLMNMPKFEKAATLFMNENKPLIDIGIGINTGEAIVGEMGSSHRSDYTVIGDSVNVASRVESLCKYYGSRLSISNFTKAQLKGEYIFRFLDYVTVKGKHEPVEIWQVHDSGKAEGALKDELESYHHAVELYKSEHFSEALIVFKELDSLEDKSNKNIYAIYIERCEHYIEFPPENFTGVFEHTTKG